MKDQLQVLLAGTKSNTTPFATVIAFIDTYFAHQPTAFKNGDAFNESTQNQGSAKVFSFAQINALNKADTLSLFAEHYQAVLAHPDATDHQNIRQFMIHGWEGIRFERNALSPLGSIAG
ncbi:HopJ type III effector protein [Pedobacter sp.]|uniref:HopJ type III effector protein n=1 Tax=Pedobacter sp. TaxID=1411316 RepID=UPI003D7F427A